MTNPSPEITTVDRIAMALGGVLVVLGVVFSTTLIALGFLVWTLYGLFEVVTTPMEPVDVGEETGSDQPTAHS